MRNILAIVLAAAIVVLAASFVPVNKTINAPAKVEKAVAAKSAQGFRNYVWYFDADLTNPTGEICDIDEEMWNLEGTYPYAFSSTFSSGMQPFVYGYYPYTLPAIIFSDYGN